MDCTICYIKDEFVINESVVLDTNENNNNASDSSNKRKFSPNLVECLVENENTESDKAVEPLEKQKKFDNSKRRKRGQNKNRPVYKDEKTLHLCHSLFEGPSSSPCPIAQCRYVHDIKQYLSDKGDDLGDQCPVFNAIGYCTRGVTCRFANAHLDEEGRNVKKAEYTEVASTTNGISKQLQIDLRKRQYDFSKTKAVVAEAERMRAISKPFKNAQCDTKNIGCAVENDKTKPLASVDFSGKVILSPLTTVGNLPFRRICKEFGADITCGEMACSVPLVKGLNQEWALTKRHKSEDIFGVQLCGNHHNIITQAAQLIQENANVDFLDLNIGCPIDLIYKQGGGCALMRRTNTLELTVRACTALNSQIPITVKMRTGIYADKSIAKDLIPLVEEWGAAAVTLHGRSREQRYTKSANWTYIEECAALSKQMPIIGNGDIMSYEEYVDKLKAAPHVSSVMIGRGALIKPWIFKEIKEQKNWDPTSTDRFEILRKYVNYGLEHWGSDTKGVENTRRFLLEWQSFLYRYVPHNLLLQPPQKINQRPQKYRGRDEMETLMSSANAQDWVKLSEILLGPVPIGFTFVPKHKANAF